jgi:hypothetical protein
LAALFLVLLFLSSGSVLAQSPDGSITGIVLDPETKSIGGAEIIAVNDLTGLKYVTSTNSEGIYSLPNLPPGPYRIQVSKVGFKAIIKPDIVLNVQDALSINFKLPIGASSVVVTVEGGAPLINTTDAVVSTVVDRQFAENLPMNGRSFQTLIQLTPGVVVTTTTAQESGQFSVNGQRAASNYWMVDGVSANIGIGASPIAGNGLGGTVGAFSASGGTNSLVSVDALQEFRIQTSTFAPEFGRTPGAQISLLTRSGTSQFHGTLFDYVRNDAFDANDWFAGEKGLSKPEERQNDFGGTFSGPLLKNKTFFFFSYEGLRLRLPQTALSVVPDVAARQNAAPALQPYLNAYPMANGPDDVSTGTAQFNASYSDPSSLDAYSVRIDHRVNDRWSLFGRFNYSPSSFVSRGSLGGLAALSVQEPFQITTETATVGATWAASSRVSDDLRFNFSSANAKSYSFMDDFGGAVPVSSLPFPSPYTTGNALFQLQILSLTPARLAAGPEAHNTQRQINLVDSLSWQKYSHSFKFGVDYRRLFPTYRPESYEQFVSFGSVPIAMGGVGTGTVLAFAPVDPLFRNVGLYAQDTWRLIPHLTLTYGLRWDLDVAPATVDGPNIPAVTGYNLSDFSRLGIARPGTPPFKTTYWNFAPRIGLAYEVSQRGEWQTVVRGGFGVFYDLASSEAGNLIGGNTPPFGNFNRVVNQPFPWTSSQIVPPPISDTGILANVLAFNPNLRLPYTVEWNVSVEQSLGKDQMLSATYIGAEGRRLIQSTAVLFPSTNPNLFGTFVDNTATSDYHALQLQFQRRLSGGLQVLGSYTWSHSIDDGSNGGSLGLPGISTRGPSDFDIRHAFTAGLTYEVPETHWKSPFAAALSHWSLQTFVVVRTAPPVDVTDANFFELDQGIQASIHPDIVPGQPLYLYGSQYPGGKAFNPNAFADPPTDPATGNPIREGNLPRNALRGFPAAQWDFSIHRDFPLRDSLKLQFRAEIFNVLNHPNFGSPNNQFAMADFGVSSQTLAQSLSNGSLGSGGFDPLYQVGGPRSVQLALRLMF